jgi:hypothetical protein
MTESVGNETIKKNTGIFCLIIGPDQMSLKMFLVMSVMFMLLQKLTFDGKFQICQISLLPTDSVILDHAVCNNCY